MACAPSIHHTLSETDRKEYAKCEHEMYPKRRILVDLNRDWQQLNFPVLIRNDLPIFYPWRASHEDDQRFGRLDSSILKAYHAHTDERGLPSATRVVMG